MNNKTWEKYSREIFGKDAEEVIRFFKADIREGKAFATENQYLKELERVLKKYCTAMKPEPEDKGFWYNRRVSLDYRPSSSKEEKYLKNILYVMGLVQKEKDVRELDGGIEEFKRVRKAEKKSEKKYNNSDEFDAICDFSPLDDEFAAADTRREGWYSEVNS